MQINIYLENNRCSSKRALRNSPVIKPAKELPWVLSASTTINKAWFSISLRLSFENFIPDLYTAFSNILNSQLRHISRWEFSIRTRWKPGIAFGTEKENWRLRTKKDNQFSIVLQSNWLQITCQQKLTRSKYVSKTMFSFSVLLSFT